VPGDSQWPGRMNELRAHRPLALWCWGEADPRLMTLRSVAIVGARACTRYGEWIAREWSAQLAQDHVTVISGGAYGIDAAAHRGGSRRRRGDDLRSGRWSGYALPAR
jgi:DNA processing protein